MSVQMVQEGDGRREVWLAIERLQPAVLKAVLALLQTAKIICLRNAMRKDAQ